MGYEEYYREYCRRELERAQRDKEWAERKCSGTADSHGRRGLNKGHEGTARRNATSGRMREKQHVTDVKEKVRDEGHEEASLVEVALAMRACAQDVNHRLDEALTLLSPHMRRTCCNGDELPNNIKEEFDETKIPQLLGTTKKELDKISHKVDTLIKGYAGVEFLNILRRTLKASDAIGRQSGPAQSPGIYSSDEGEELQVWSRGDGIWRPCTVSKNSSNKKVEVEFIGKTKEVLRKHFTVPSS